MIYGPSSMGVGTVATALADMRFGGQRFDRPLGRRDAGSIPASAHYKFGCVLQLVELPGNEGSTPSASTKITQQHDTEGGERC